LVRGPIRPRSGPKSPPSPATPTHATCSLKSPRVHHAPERAPTIVAARPALPALLGRGRATLTPSASLYLTPHTSMFLPLAPCLPWWCPAPCLPGGAPGCRRCYSSGLLPPKPSALSASCSPALPCSNALHLLRRFHADALPAEVSQRPTSPSCALCTRKKKKDPRVRGKQVQGVFCTVIDSCE
jgi:hypothetical protein